MGDFVIPNIIGPIIEFVDEVINTSPLRHIMQTIELLLCIEARPKTRSSKQYEIVALFNHLLPGATIWPERLTSSINVQCIINSPNHVLSRYCVCACLSQCSTNFGNQYRTGKICHRVGVQSPFHRRARATASKALDRAI